MCLHTLKISPNLRSIIPNLVVDNAVVLYLKFFWCNKLRHSSNKLDKTHFQELPYSTYPFKIREGFGDDAFTSFLKTIFIVEVDSDYR